jgi:hypothetical protein
MLTLILKILNTNHLHLYFRRKFIIFHKISLIKLQYLEFPGNVWRTLLSTSITCNFFPLVVTVFTLKKFLSLQHLKSHNLRCRYCISCRYRSLCACLFNVCLRSSTGNVSMSPICRVVLCLLQNVHKPIIIPSYCLRSWYNPSDYRVPLSLRALVDVDITT